jgi:predicted nucleotidyltransferase
MKMLESIKTIILQEIIKLYGKRLAKIILYGSYARGDYHENSDIDFLIVLNDEEILVGKELAYMNKAIFQLTLQYNIAISHYPTTKHRFENSQSMFYQQIRKEGKIIYERRNRENNS